MTDQNNSYGTSDLYLASYLKASGLKLLDAEKGGRRVLFLFENSKKTKELVMDYHNDGLIRVNAYKNALQDLKGLVYNI